MFQNPKSLITIFSYRNRTLETLDTSTNLKQTIAEAFKGYTVLVIKKSKAMCYYHGGIPKVTYETKCFCTHPLKYHNQENVNKIDCSVLGCICLEFLYVPAYGIHDFNCICKHSYKDHHVRTKKCRKERCMMCVEFNTGWTCDCGFRYIQHATHAQKKEDHKVKFQSMDVQMNQTIENQKKVFQERRKKLQDIGNEQVRKQIEFEERKKALLQKVNQKFQGNKDLQIYYGIQNGLLENKSCREQTHKREQKTPYELYLQSHNYSQVKIGRFLAQNYEKQNKVDFTTFQSPQDAEKCQYFLI